MAPGPVAMSNDLYACLRELVASAEARPAVMRPVLLCVITDLFLLHPRHRPEEIHLYEEMAGKLVPDADEASLAIVARKLAEAADAPASVMKLVRERGGAAAREMLRVDPRIEWRELGQIAASGAADHAAAIAGRRDLDRELTKILSQRPERDIALALSANALAPLALGDLRRLISRGRCDADLARALLDRGDLTLDCLPLYLAANATERARLIKLARCASLARVSRPDSAPLDGQLCLRLETSAARHRACFALTLAETLDCDADCGRRLVEDESGDALTLACIALGLPGEICARIFRAAFPNLSRENFDRNLALVASLPRRDATAVIGAITGAKKSAAASFRAEARRGPLAAAAQTAYREETAYFPLATTPTIGPIGSVKSSRSSSGA
jgi:uncharacterized protein (DUF2336 family)